MKIFHAALANSMAAFLVNTFIWFAVTFWVFLETKSVIATSIMAGVYSATIALSGFFLGSVVDHYSKKSVMRFSSMASLALYGFATLIIVLTPYDVFRNASSPQLWAFILLALFGAIAGNLRGIAMSTLVTILVPEEERDKANGLVGTMNGVAFLGASIFSGLVVGYLGILAVFIIALVTTALVLIHLATLSIPSGLDTQQQSMRLHERVDLRGTIQAIGLIPGLYGLIFFNTFNNFLGGVLMSLMDAYGLQLVSVQVWGALWGFLSLGFVVGGLLVTRMGLGKNPLRSLFLANIAAWMICSLFTIQASIVLLTFGLFLWLCLVPVMEAAEQTILQKVVPQERQGRVFGFAQSVEQAASPITSFIIGPIAQLIFIPFMTTGAGVRLIGPWFGTGSDRGLALLFTIAGLIGLGITLISMRSFAYRALSARYQDQAQELGEISPA
jgi:DHA3 family multidrug efflux protein-like MFS transporter